MFHLEAERLGAKCVPMKMQWPSQISLMCSAPLKTLYSCGKPQMRSSLWAVSQPNLFPNPAKLQCSSSSENYKNYNVAQVQKRIWCNLGCFAECSRIHGGYRKNIECNIFLASSWIIFCVQRVCVYEVDRKCTRYTWPGCWRPGKSGWGMVAITCSQIQPASMQMHQFQVIYD